MSVKTMDDRAIITVRAEQVLRAEGIVLRYTIKRNDVLIGSEQDTYRTAQSTLRDDLGLTFDETMAVIEAANALTSSDRVEDGDRLNAWITIEVWS